VRIDDRDPFVLLKTRNRPDERTVHDFVPADERLIRLTKTVFCFRLRSDVRRGRLRRVVRHASFRPDPVRDSTDRRRGTSTREERNESKVESTDDAIDAVETSPNSSTNHPSRRQLPAIALGAFIIYSILTVALSVVFFPSRPTEARSLARDVLRARRRLAARGVALS